MAIRNDLTVDWDADPRIITVDAPSVEITIQDLYDTCKYLEATPGGMDDPVLIDAAGKEDLGGGVSVGLTATLSNALLAFEARLGPTYVQCRVNGGNLVAVDSLGDTFSTPISPTAFTQVITTASSSATSQNQASIEYGSFEGGVWVKQSGTITGTDGLKGNAQFPVNNFADAVAIASMRGLPEKIYVIGNATLDTGDNIEGFTLVGQNPARTTITVNSGADTQGCEIMNASITGNLDGGTILRECVITSLNYINGFVYHCMLNPGTVTLGGVDTAHFLDCYSGVPGVSTPIIDMNGTGNEDTPLAIRGYSGGIRLIEKTGVGAASVDFNSGHLYIDSTCTAGTIVARGAAGVTVDDGATVTVIDQTVNSVIEQVPDMVWGAQKSNYTTPGTMGHWVASKLLTLTKWLSLR